jgi:vitamin B12 transporter
MLKKALFSCIFFSLFLVLSARADDSARVFVLDDLIVTSSPLLYPVEITGTPDRSKKTDVGAGHNFTTVSEFLESFGEITVRIPGGPGHIASPNLGGLSGNKVLVIKDGLPLNDPFTGSPDIGDLPLINYEAVEIWQDNRATLWGSNSIGGVIRLRSRFPEPGKLKWWNDGVGGNGFAAECALDFSRSRAGIRIGHFFTPGWSAASSQRGNTERDSFELDDYAFAFRSELGSDFEMDLLAGYKESLTELDGFDFVSGLAADSLTFRQKKIESNFNLGLSKIVKGGEWRFNHAFVHRNYTGIDEANSFNEYGLEVSQQRQSISRTINADRYDLLAEVSRMETRAMNHGFFTIRDIEHSAVTALDYRFEPDLQTNLVYRYDKIDGGNAVSSGNINVSKKIERFEIAMGWGRAFRRPSLNERFYPAYGDPELSAEFSTSNRIKISYSFANDARLACSFSRFKISDLIGTTSTTDPAFSWGIKAANLNSAELVTHEFSLEELKFASCKLNGSFSLLDRSRLLDSGLQPPGVPSRRAMLNLEKKLHEFTLLLSGKWWGTAWENAENTKASEAGADLSVTLSHARKNVITSLSLLNLLNEEKERLLGYTRPGRRAVLSVELKF